MFQNQTSVFPDSLPHQKTLFLNLFPKRMFCTSCSVLFLAPCKHGEGVHECQGCYQTMVFPCILATQPQSQNIVVMGHYVLPGVQQGG